MQIAEIANMDSFLDELILNKVFSNDVVGDILMQHLDLTSLKNLRETCKTVKDAIDRRFQSMAKLIICRKSVEAGVLEKMGEWRHLKICLYKKMNRMSANAKKNLGDILENHVQSLHLHLDRIRHWQFQDRIPTWFVNCEGVFTMKKLKSLEVHIILWNVPISTSAFLKASFASSVENLETLIMGKREQRLGPEIKRLEVDFSSVFWAHASINDNLSLVSDHCKNLAEMNILFNFYSLDEGTNQAIRKTILKILQKNAKIITSLNIDELNFFSQKEEIAESVKSLRFPMLKTLKVENLLPTSTENFNPFLSNQNEASLRCLDFQFYSFLPLEVLFTIKTKCANLKKMHIKVGNTSVQHPPDYNWEFLRELKYLADFSFDYNNSQFTRPRNDNTPPTDLLLPMHFVTCTELLENHPQVAKKVNLEGLSSYDKAAFNLFNFDPFVNDFSSPWFENLTQLNLLRCQDALNDANLQYIFSHITQLHTFQFSHCSSITDFGITGIVPQEVQEGQEVRNPGVSISNLKDLKTLTIRKCKMITPVSIQGIVFSKLSELTLGENPRIWMTPDIVTSLVSQNPELKSLKMSCVSLRLRIAKWQLSKAVHSASNGKCSLEILEHSKLYEFEDDAAIDHPNGNVQDYTDSEDEEEDEEEEEEMEQNP